MLKKKSAGRTFHHAPTVQPANRFVGVILADGQEAPVTSLACQETGEVVVLVLTGPRTTLAAIAALVFLKKTKKQIRFLPVAEECWYGPEHLQSMQKHGSSQIASSVGPTTYKNIVILANVANMAYCQQNPVPFPDHLRVPAVPTTEVLLLDPQQPQRSRPHPRFVLGCEGSEHPDWLTFTGMMRSLWLPFPLEFASAIWQAGVQEYLQPLPDELNETEKQTRLIEPVEHCLGIQAWQVSPTRQWEAVIKREACHIYALRQPF